MPHPNLFLVGAPKCGTSALHDYLAQHPNIFMTDPKEPHHFCPDLAAPYAYRDRGAYLSLYATAKPQHTVWGESSATYLYSQVAAETISQTYPDAKIIAMLRSPLEMLPSLHSQKRVNGTEEVARFEEALEAEQKRKAGELPARGAFPFYYDAAMYAAQLTRYFERFPRENVHVIIFDDFKRDAAKVYAEVLEFLDLSPFNASLKIVNRNKRVRSRAVHNVLQNPESRLNRLPSPLNRFLYKAVDKLNSANVKREPLSNEVRAKLVGDFTPEVARLSELLGRDLGFWLS